MIDPGALLLKSPAWPSGAAPRAPSPGPVARRATWDVRFSRRGEGPPPHDTPLSAETGSTGATVAGATSGSTWPSGCVMTTAEQHEVSEGGGATLGPVLDVMALAQA